MNGQMELERLARENGKLQKINRVLMGRVERSMNQETSDFALFEQAILLEGEVRARTLALENALADLRHAKAEAERANSSKTRFLAAASHDLLQPLNAARLFVAALAETEQSSANRSLIGNIDDAFAAVEAMLSALLEISRLDSGSLNVRRTDFRLDDIMKRLLAEFAPLAEAKDLRLRYVPSGAVVRTDPDLLGRVLRNLLTNAIRYTRHGGVLFGVRPRDGAWRIDVVDSGIGIPDEQQDEIFEEFRRLRPDHEAGTEGVGLGLAIVQRILSLLDHRIEVRSTPGRGSRFGLYLPRGAASAADAPAPSIVDHGRQRGNSAVLVIENEPSVRESMQAILEAWGYQAVTAASGEAGIEAMRACGRRPDLVVADYHLDDDLTGPEAIETVRAAFDPSLPAFIITADYSNELREKLADQGLKLLTKPVKPAKLRAILMQLTPKAGR